ncbi:MAG: hypothetical protein HRU81_02625 [Gammaproteobacteria bacterium]|nr:MAG: hypothetical protein HRU81_02625 [Gammaproteobacteria bacterium]
MKKNLCGIALLATMSLTAAAVQAGTILQPVAATSGMGNYSSQYLPSFAIDQSGLLPSAYVSGVTDFDVYVPTAYTTLSSGGSGFKIWYSSTGTLTGNFDFDLGGQALIESLALWNDPQSAGQGVNSFSLWADDNSAFSSPTLLGNFTAVEGLGNANYAQVFGFTPTAAAYVRMTILSNHGSTFVTGISEAAFEVAAVPVPAAVWLLGSGLVGLIGLGRRRSH